MMPMFTDGPWFVEARFSVPGPDVEQMRAHELANDESFGEVDAGQRAELRVAALDELLKRGDVSRVSTASGPAGVNWLTWHASARRFVS